MDPPVTSPAPARLLGALERMGSLSVGRVFSENKSMVRQLSKVKDMDHHR